MYSERKMLDVELLLCLDIPIFGRHASMATLSRDHHKVQTISDCFEGTQDIHSFPISPSHERILVLYMRVMKKAFVCSWPYRRQALAILSYLLVTGMQLLMG